MGKQVGREKGENSLRICRGIEVRNMCSTSTTTVLSAGGYVALAAGTDRGEKRADDGLRTRDLQLGKLALYQLSYVRVGGYFSTPEVALSLL